MRGMSLPGRLLDVDGVRTFVHRSGRGEPLVLVHGLLVSHWIWRPVAKPLSGEAEVIAFDLPGHGEADRPSPHAFDYTPLGLAHYCDRVLELLGISGATVVGHSFGGAVALALAALHPERVRALLAVDAVALPFRLPLSGQLVLSPGIGETLFKRVYSRGQMAAHFESAFTDRSLASDLYVDYYWERLNRPGGRDATYAMIRAMAGLDLSPLLGEIRAPTAVLFGERDRIVPPAHAERLAALIPGARAEVLAGCGHSPAEEMPERFIEAVRALRRQPSGARLQAAS